MKKLSVLLAISSSLFLIGPGVQADSFIPEENFNKFTVERYAALCWIEEDGKITQYCDFTLSSPELKEKLEIANWYNDFDTVMRFKMYNEVLWDYRNNPYDTRDPWVERAYNVISDYSSNFISNTDYFIKNKNNTEKDYKAIVYDNVYAYNRDLDKIVIWYSNILYLRNDLVEKGKFDDTWKFNALYVGDLDEIHDLIEETYYPYWHEDDIEKWETVFFPNVRKYLELHTMWTVFYRTQYSAFDDETYKMLGYSKEAQELAEKWEYFNEYNNKIDFYFDLDQEIGGTILDGDTTTSISVLTEKKEMTLLEQYEQAWDRSIEEDYDRVLKVLNLYVTSQKSKWVSQLRINQLFSSMLSQLPAIYDIYLEKYENSTGTQKAKFQNTVWMILILEKVLEENTF